MKAADIIIGGVYSAKVSNDIVKVRVNSINTGGSRTTYSCTNLKTKREITVKSAQRFRRRETAGTVVGRSPEGRIVVGKPAEVLPLIPETEASTEGKLVLEAAHAAVMVIGLELGAEPLALRPFELAEFPSPHLIDIKPETAQTPTPVTAPTTRMVLAPPPQNGTGLGGLAAKLAKAQDDSPHLIVKARAGTGKTTTLIEGLRALRAGSLEAYSRLPKAMTPSAQQRAVWEAMLTSAGKASSVCFVAFNRSIAHELKRRVPADCEASTMHALGLKVCAKAFNLLPGDNRVNKYRVGQTLAKLLNTDVMLLVRERGPFIKLVEDLVEKCRMNLVGFGPGSESISWPDELMKLVSYYDMDLENIRDLGEVFDVVPRLLHRLLDVASDRQVDTGDMIWLPVVLDLPVPKYDILLVDEAQDLNLCQQALAKMAGRRLILCGDDRQAIYGFAGADAESLPRMFRQLNEEPRKCLELPLTVTRRCGKAIVEEAKKLVPDFEAFETNPEGIISEAKYPIKRGSKSGATDREIPYEQTYMPQVKQGDMILCRVNAPLVSQCFRFLAHGRKANILGREIGAQIIEILQKIAKRVTMTPEQCPVADLIPKMEEWLEQEATKENARKQPSEAKLIMIQDRFDCLMCFTEGAQYVGQMIDKVNAIFSDDRDSPGIKLSSIHKAKGLEADRVFLLMPEGGEIPHPMARTEWGRGQELNLKYVAITRAIRELTYVR